MGALNLLKKLIFSTQSKDKKTGVKIKNVR